MIIGLLAKKQHGKDTMADYLVDHCGFQKDALAAPLKDMCRTAFLLSDEQLYGDQKELVDARYGVSTRQIMQFVGTELFRNQMGKLIPKLGNNIWVHLQELRYLEAVNEDPKVRFVVSDIRMPNEVEMIHKLGGKVIKIVRPELDNNQDQHASEQIDLIEDYDLLIENDGTVEEYYKKIDLMMDKILE